MSKKTDEQLMKLCEVVKDIVYESALGVGEDLESKFIERIALIHTEVEQSLSGEQLEPDYDEIQRKTSTQLFELGRRIAKLEKAEPSESVPAKEVKAKTLDMTNIAGVLEKETYRVAADVADEDTAEALCLITYQCPACHFRHIENVPQSFDSRAEHCFCGFYILVERE